MIKDENKEKEVTSETPSTEDRRVDDALAAVNELKESLASNLADVTAENESLHAEADESVAKLSAQDEKIKELEKSLEEAKAAAEAAEGRLQDIERSQLVAKRVRFLKENSISRSTEETLLKQAEKCADMSEEEFDAYTSDLLDIRNTVLAQFKAAEKEAEKEEELKAEVEEIKASDEETAASVDEIDEKLKKILSDEGLLGAPNSQEETTAEESEEEESSTEEEASEDSEEAAAKESASVKTKDYTKALLACFE